MNVLTFEGLFECSNVWMEKSHIQIISYKKKQLIEYYAHVHLTASCGIAKCESDDGVAQGSGTG